MVRRFSTDPVPKDALERIARAAKRAPSAGFSQGQRLVIVTDPALMAQVAEGADEDSYADIGYHRWVSQCGAQFVPCVSERLYHERYQQPDKLEDGKELIWPIPYWWMDIGCTVMLIILAAIDERPRLGVRRALPTPEGHEPDPVGPENPRPLHAGRDHARRLPASGPSVPLAQTRRRQARGL